MTSVTSATFLVSLCYHKPELALKFPVSSKVSDYKVFIFFQENFSSSGITAVATDNQNNHIEDFIPRCHLVSFTYYSIKIESKHSHVWSQITSIIFKYLSTKDLLNLSKTSRIWFTPCREYLRSRQCLLVLDQVDGLEALQRLCQVLDSKIMNQCHPFTGILLRFSDPIDDFFKVGTGPNKRPQPIAPEDGLENAIQNAFDYSEEGGSENDDYDYENHDYSQDYESLHAWIYRKGEEAREKREELQKLDGPLKRIFAKIPSMKHVHMVVDYGTKRGFQRDKFKRYISLLPLKGIEYFRTNIRISEFIGDLRAGQLSNLKTLYIDGLKNAFQSTLDQLFAICPVLENWDSPIPGNMVASFGTKKYLIKNLILYSYVKPGHFTQIHDANLSLTTLIASAPTCAIGKGSYDETIRIIRENSGTLHTIQMSEAFLKHVIASNLTPIDTVRKIIIQKCAKVTKNKALATFPNAIFVEREK